MKLISSHATLERLEKWKIYWEVLMERGNGEGHKKKKKGGTRATYYLKAHVTWQRTREHIGHSYTLKHALKNKLSIRQRFTKKAINEKARAQSANPFSWSEHSRERGSQFKVPKHAERDKTHENTPDALLSYAINQWLTLIFLIPL